MIGILCEKPSAARNFAAALGGATGTYNGERYTIVASHGHLYGFNTDPDAHVDNDLKEKYKSWSLGNLPWNENDFKWKTVAKDKSDDTPKKIKEVLSGCDEICIATDDDPTGEGELIAWEIILQNNIKAKKYTRIYHEDESPKAIQKAFVARKTLGNDINCAYDDADYKKAIFRTKWDYLSMQWTRAATNINPSREQLLRNGRLKSAMIVLVGDQLKLVDEYVKKPFYQNRFKDENGIIYTNKEEPTFNTAAEVPNIYHSSAVVLDKKEIKESAPPKYIDLATLSAMLEPKGIPAKTTLATYQKMYEAGVVSYPRTEDKCITEEQFKQLLPVVDSIARLLDVDTSLLTHREPRKTHIKSGMAHGANRPGLSVPSSLDTLDEKFGVGAKQIYTILGRNYLATLCENYRYEKQDGHVADYPKFVGVAKVPVSLGWKEIYQDNDDEEEETSNKALGTQAEPFVYEGCNPKPTAPTAKWLMKQLEKRNVGTGATRTSIYSDVTNQKTKYPLLVAKKGKLTFAPCGEANYKLLPGTHIGDLSLTEKVMEQMDKVGKGLLDEETCLHEIQQMIVEDIQTMKANAPTGTSASSKEGFIQKEKADGVWSKTGETVSISKTWGTHEFTDEELSKLLDGEMISFIYSGKSGEQTVYGKLGEQEFKGKKFVGFIMDHAESPDKATGVWAKNGQTISFKNTWGAHKFTQEEVKALLADETISFTTEGKFGTQTVSGKLGESEYKGHKFIGFIMDRSGASSSGKKNDIPDEWSSHVFTDAEKAALKKGEAVYAEDFWSNKKNKHYPTNVKWLKVKGVYKIVPEFSSDYKK